MDIQPVSISNAEHYAWGMACDGWHLLKRGELSVIQERVPAGASETPHYHNTARQFFYILAGEATMVFDDGEVQMKKGDGQEIPPNINHQFKNHSATDVNFLVISYPPTSKDRVNI